MKWTCFQRRLRQRKCALELLACTNLKLSENLEMFAFPFVKTSVFVYHLTDRKGSSYLILEKENKRNKLKNSIFLYLFMYKDRRHSKNVDKMGVGKLCSGIMFLILFIKVYVLRLNLNF